MSYLPSGKLVLTVLALLFVGSGLFYLENGFPSKPATESTNASLTPKNIPDASSSILNLPTSSISKGAKKNPDDTGLSSANLPSPTGRLLLNFRDLYQSGIIPPDATTTSNILTENVVSDIKKLEAQKNHYAMTDVTIDNKASARTYLNGFASITRKYFPEDPTSPDYENEVIVISTTISEKKDLSELSDKLQKYIYRYSAVAQELKKSPVAEEAAEAQLALLNSFWNTSLALREIADYKNDPVVGALGMKNYENETVDIKKALFDLKKYAAKNQVTFSKEEPGYDLVHYFNQYQ